MICPNCHTENPDSNKFCKKCGVKFPERKYCAHCGAILLSNVKFCSHCGFQNVSTDETRTPTQSSQDNFETKSIRIPTTNKTQNLENSYRLPSGKAFDPNKSSNSFNPYIIGAVLVLIVFLGFGGWYYFESTSKDTSKSSKNFIWDRNSNTGDVEFVAPVDTYSENDETQYKKESSTTSSYAREPDFDFIYLKGKIANKYPINMVLDIPNKSGQYCYDKYGPKNSMRLDITRFEDDYIEMDEYNDEGVWCGSWSGYIRNEMFNGTGVFHEKEMPFSLKMVSKNECLY